MKKMIELSKKINDLIMLNRKVIKEMNLIQNNLLYKRNEMHQKSRTMKICIFKRNRKLSRINIDSIAFEQNCEKFYCYLVPKH